MQTETRTTAHYYVQWLDDKGQYGTPGAWVTSTDDLNCGGYETAEQARNLGVIVCFEHAGPESKWPPHRIVQRLTVETVIPN
jgi:hypothetical protein